MAFKTVWAERRVQKLAHSAFNLIGLALAILGVYAVFKFHSDINIPNVYSLHSWVGIGTISLFGVQVRSINYTDPSFVLIILAMGQFTCFQARVHLLH